jgi:conjugative relaxase-like TrwC/TraI family protein
MVAAKFEHESSRKLDPQLHTHVVVMNMTRRRDGAWRALEPREMFAAQKLVTATYRAEMARALTRLGYPVELRSDGSVGIGGFTKRSITSASGGPRSRATSASVVSAVPPTRSARRGRRAGRR